MLCVTAVALLPEAEGGEALPVGAGVGDGAAPGFVQFEAVVTRLSSRAVAEPLLSDGEALPSDGDGVGVSCSAGFGLPVGVGDGDVVGEPVGVGVGVGVGVTLGEGDALGEGPGDGHCVFPGLADVLPPPLCAFFPASWLPCW